MLTSAHAFICTQPAHPDSVLHVDFSAYFYLWTTRSHRLSSACWLQRILLFVHNPTHTTLNTNQSSFPDQCHTFSAINPTSCICHHPHRSPFCTLTMKANYHCNKTITVTRQLKQLFLSCVSSSWPSEIILTTTAMLSYSPPSLLLCSSNRGSNPEAEKSGGCGWLAGSAELLAFSWSCVDLKGW